MSQAAAFVEGLIVRYNRTGMPVQTPLNIMEMLPATFTAPDLTDEEFLEVCEQLPEDAQVEYTEEGEILVMPPTDPMSGVRNVRVVHRLASWAEKIGRGFVTGP